MPHAAMIPETEDGKAAFIDRYAALYAAGDDYVTYIMMRCVVGDE